MKKINIVSSNIEFNEIIKTCNFVKNKYFVIYYKDNELYRYRFGISVPKKVCNAVNRNKLKRQVRNILDNCKKLYSNCKDYIIIVRRSCLDLNFQILETNLQELLKKIEKETNNERKEK